MTPTTHVASSCLIAVATLHSGLDNVQKVVTVAGSSFILHLILDILPHGYIATPATIFKKIVPTIVEMLPPPLILITAIWLFDNAFLFLTASFFGILPDIISTLFYKRREMIARIPYFMFIHKIHRKVHWFETEHADGTVSFLFPNVFLLVCEAFFIIIIITVLFFPFNNL
jgi:hypothetical protein